MKILHTSDLHLGKRLFDRDRLPEQILVLDEIAALCEKEEVSLVLLAGDVFDTYLPPAEAEEVFFRALKRLAGEERAVVAVSGNHDDGVRLSASVPLCEEQGIYLFGGTPKKFPLGGNRKIKAVESGENWIVLSDGKESVYINALPYPNEALLKGEKSEESYSEKVKRWIARGNEGYRGDMPYLLLSHLFVAGGKTSESERDIDLGGARAVPLSALPEEGYIALGHLHRPQKIRNARYSGSILPYSFDEANTKKSVVLLQTEGKKFLEREIPLSSGRRLVRLECESLEAALKLLPAYENSYLELTLHLKEPLTSKETRLLRETNEGLVSLIAHVESGEQVPVFTRSALSGKQLFTEYYRSVYGEDPKEDLLAAFLSLTEEET